MICKHSHFLWGFLFWWNNVEEWIKKNFPFHTEIILLSIEQGSDGDASIGIWINVFVLIRQMPDLYNQTHTIHTKVTLFWNYSFMDSWPHSRKVHPKLSPLTERLTPNHQLRAPFKVFSAGLALCRILVTNVEKKNHTWQLFVEYFSTSTASKENSCKSVGNE